MARKKRLHAPDNLDSILPEFRDDLIEWCRRNGMGEAECSLALGRHRSFVSYQRRGVQEPKVTTMIEVYNAMREYENRPGYQTNVEDHIDHSLPDEGNTDG